MPRSSATAPSKVAPSGSVMGEAGGETRVAHGIGAPQLKAPRPPPEKLGCFLAELTWKLLSSPLCGYLASCSLVPRGEGSRMMSGRRKAVTVSLPSSVLPQDSRTSTLPTHSPHGPQLVTSRLVPDCQVLFLCWGGMGGWCLLQNDTLDCFGAPFLLLPGWAHSGIVRD